MTINKHNEIRKNFNNEYLKVLSPLFQSLEPLRQKYVQKFFGVAFMSVFLPLTFIGLPLAFRYYFGDTEAFIQGGDFYFVTCIFILMFLAGVLIAPFLLIYLFTGEIFVSLKKDFQNEIKKQCLEKVLKSFGEIKPSTLTPKDLRLIGESGLGFYTSSDNRSKHITQIQCDDCMNGVYKDVEFRLLEISNGEHSWGRLIISFASNKTIKASAIIAPKNCTPVYSIDGTSIQHAFALLIEFGSLYFIGSGICSTLQSFLTGGGMSSFYQFIAFLLLGVSLLCFIWFTIKKLFEFYVGQKTEKIKLEDTQFNVSSKDEVEARYLLTPSFIERFKKLQMVYNSRDIKCAFFKDQIMFAINTQKDFFELGSLFVPMSDTRQIEKFYNEIIAIYDMIDYFKLNEKTGL